MINTEKRGMVSAVRVLKDSDFTDVHVDIDNYCGEKRDPILVGKLTIWKSFKLNLDNFLLKKRRK